MKSLTLRNLSQLFQSGMNITIIFVRQYIVKHSGFLIALTLKPLIYDLIQILFLQSAK